MENKAIVLSTQRELTPQTWQMLKDLAPVMHQSRLFGVSSPDQAAAIMLKGYELGLSITASFELVQVIQGRPALSPRGAMALLHNNPEIEQIKVTRLTDNKGAFLGYDCYMKRRNGFEYTARWTMDDARKAGLIKPDSGWEKYPENMCMWRAIGFCADVVAPDITAGMTGLMKMPEQYGVALDAQGDVIDVTPSDPITVAESKAPAEVTFTLEELCDTFGAEAILAVNEGKIPQTDDEVQAVAKKLVGA